MGGKGINYDTGARLADGIEVWFAPFPCDMTIEQLLPYFAECAARAEDLTTSPIAQ